jgi:methyltransferase
MEISATLYFVFLALVAVERLVEMRISGRHQEQLTQRGIPKRPDPRFRWMVGLHSGLLAGAAIEVLVFHRRFLPVFGTAMVALFGLATALRWWAIHSLGAHWNVQIMASGSLGVVSRGPYRWVRHPNYLGVFLEMLALPLIHGAWITATIGAAFHAWILRHRIALEESVLEADSGYREVMAGKPRFLPGAF